MKEQQKIIQQCDKMIELIDEVQVSLKEASKIAMDYLEYRRIRRNAEVQQNENH